MVKKNETVLIHAGASGVGTAAIQLAKHISDAKVIVTAGSKRKLDFCRELGADVLINYKEQSFDEEVLKATKNIIPYFEDKKIKPIIDTKFSLEDIGKAHLHMEGNQNIGKIIINVCE